VPALRADYDKHPTIQFREFLPLSKLKVHRRSDLSDEIENGKQQILGLHVNFELNWSVHMHVRTSSHRRSDLRQK
jgi:hypothetical protein